MTEFEDTSGVERLLTASRPRPPDELVANLESRLFPAGSASRQRRRPHLQFAFAALTAATALAVVAVILALAGTGPFAADDNAARAKPNCEWTSSAKPGRVPVVVETKAGPRIVYRDGTVRTRERVCR